MKKMKKDLKPAEFIPLFSNLEKFHQEALDAYRTLMNATDFLKQRECIIAFAKILATETTSNYNKDLTLQLAAEISIACTPNHEIITVIRRQIFNLYDDDIRDVVLTKTLQAILDVVFEKQDMLITSRFLDSLILIEEMAKPVEANAKALFLLVLNFLMELIKLKLSEVEKIELEKWLSFVSIASRFLLFVLPDGKVNEVIEESCIAKLLSCVFELMEAPEMNVHIQGNLGYSMVQVLNELPDKYRKECVYSNFPFLDLLLLNKQPLGSYLQSANIKYIADDHINDTFHVSICGAILLIQDNFKEVLLEKIGDKKVVHFIFDKYCEIAEKGCKKVLCVKSLLTGLNTLAVLIYDFDLVPIYIKRCLDLMTIYADVSDSIVNDHIKKILANIIRVGHTNLVYYPTVMKWVTDLPIVTVRYLAISEICKTLGAKHMIEQYPNIMKQLLIDLLCCYNTNMVTQCIKDVMESYSKYYDVNTSEGEKKWVEKCVVDIIPFLQTRSTSIIPSLGYREIFVNAFKIHASAIAYLATRKLFKTDNELCAFLQCVAEIKGDEYKYKNYDPVNEILKTMTQHNLLDSLIIYNNDEVRLLTLKILVSPNAPKTRIYNVEELTFIEKFFYFNINTTKPSLKAEFMALLKHVIYRIHQSSDIYHNNPSKMSPASLNKLQQNYMGFRKGLMKDTLFVGLSAGCNHFRRLFCLEILSYLGTCEDKDNYQKFYTPRELVNLKDIILTDSYEQNKQLACELMCQLPANCLVYNRMPIVRTQILHSMKLANLQRTGSGLTAALMLQVCLCTPHFSEAIKPLIESIPIENKEDFDYNDNSLTLMTYLISHLMVVREAARQDLTKCISSMTIHGFITCIQKLLLKTNSYSKKQPKPYWKWIFRQLINCCLDFAKIVEPIICNASPEGNLPTFCETNVMSEGAKSQLFNVFGWRATKEISTLFGDIVCHIPISTVTSNDGLIDEQQLKRIADYFFHLLLNCKHKGAFEQASFGFTRLCSKLWNAKTSSFHNLPAEWLAKIFEMIKDTGKEDTEACPTRRSAGIPFMVQSILVTNADGLLLSSTMDLMLGIAENSKMPEYKIHIYNIMRILFRNAKLSKLMSKNATNGMLASLKGFRSENWGVRNSATLLFSSVMIKIFGSRIMYDRDNLPTSMQNKMAAKLFFSSYQKLYLFMFQELSDAVTEKKDDTLYPVLLLFSQLAYYSESDSALQRMYVMKCVDICLHHSSYKIRDLAAKVYVQLIKHSKIMQHMLGCINRLSNPTLSDTYCHGTLLQLQYMLDMRVNNVLDQMINKYRYNDNKINIPDIIDGTGWILVCCPTIVSHLTASAYIDFLMHLILRYDPEFINCDIFNHITTLLVYHIKIDEKYNLISIGHKKFRVLLFQLKLYMSLHLKVCSECDRKWKGLYSDLKIYEKDLRHFMYLQDHLISYIRLIKMTFVKYKWFAEYEQYHTLYMESFIRLLNKLKESDLSYLYQVMNDALKKLVTKNKEDKKVAQFTKPVFYEMIGFQDYLDFFPNFPTFYKNKCVLKHILNLCMVSERRIAYRAVLWLDDFLYNLKEDELKIINLTETISLLYDWSLPFNEFILRFGVSKLLVHNRRIYYRKEWILNFNNLYKVWIIIFTLLEDDAEEIRNTISELAFYNTEAIFGTNLYLPVVGKHLPSSARRNIMHDLVRCMPLRCTLAILTYLILRPSRIMMTTDNLVFNEGETNSNIELHPIAKEATKMMLKIFFEIKGGVVINKINNFPLLNRAFHSMLIMQNILYMEEMFGVTPQMLHLMRKSCNAVIAFWASSNISRDSSRHKFAEILACTNLIKNADPPLPKCEEHRLRMLTGCCFHYQAYVLKS